MHSGSQFRVDGNYLYECETDGNFVDFSDI